MTNSINFSQINFKGSTNLIEQFKAKQTDVTPQDKPQVPAADTQASGADALSSYNKAALVPEKQAEENVDVSSFDIEPLKAKVIDKDFIANFKGEKVMSSRGTLSHYEEKDGDVSKIYVANPEGKVATAVEVNNKNGKILREDAYDENGNAMFVTEYNPETGMKSKYTSFHKETGKPEVVVLYDEKGEFVKNVFYGKDGKIKNALQTDKGVDGAVDISYEFENGLPKTKYTRTTDGTPIETTVFNKGKELYTIKNDKIAVINHTDYDYSKVDLKPSELGNIETDITKVNGEKKFRSNNTLEEIRVKDGNKETVYTMDFTGNRLVDITEWENDKQKRSIRFNGENGKVDCISEYFTDGQPDKSTHFDKDGNPEGIAEYKNDSFKGDTLRDVFFFPDGKIKGYDFCDNEGNLKALFRMDKEGNLIEVDEFNKDGKDIDGHYNSLITKVENKTSAPDNAQKVETFKTRLNDANWTKEYNPQTNSIYMKQNGMIDGMEYEIFSNGTVMEHGCWVKTAVIMNSNQEIADFFKANKK